MHNLPLDEVDAICETLLLKGIIIRNDALSQDEDDNFYDRSQLDYESVFNEVVSIDKTMLSFIDEVRQIRPPQTREWQNLIVQGQNGNIFARERIITMYLRVVVRIALWYYKKYNIEISEAIQNGSQGLIVALNKFEIERQDKFSTYAPWWIRQCIMREAQVINSIVYYPTYYKDKIFDTYEICADHNCELCQDYYDCPTLIYSVAEKLSCDESEARALIDALIPMESIEDNLENNECCFSDWGFFCEEMFDDVVTNELSQLIQDELSKLNQREQEVISMRYGLLREKTWTLEEIGQIYGVTRERIRQIEAKAIRNLRKSSIFKNSNIL